MTYQDTWAICTQCGKRFIFRIEDQRRQAERGESITPPELCPDCRPGSQAGPRRPRFQPSARGGGTATDPWVALGPGPHEGSVKWFDGEKGYGFIAHGDGMEIFFHRTGIAPGESLDFPDGTRVTFLVEQSEKGPQAVDVAHMDATADEPFA